MPELRKDPIISRWVIIATERGKRPHDFQKIEEEPSVAGICALCPGNESMTPPEIAAYREPGTLPNTPGWWIRVVPNKFPALKETGDLNRTGFGVYDMMNGIGIHEVIIETAKHNGIIPELSQKEVEEMLWMYRDRYLALSTDPRIKYVLIFKNHGRSAGASLEHPHSQLIATPVIPKRVMEELEGAQNYYKFRERCVFCDIIRQEISSRERIVLENDSFVSIEPFASRFPFETWILPKKHMSTYSEIDRKEIMDLAHILKNTLTKIYHSLSDPPYNFIIHTAPINNECKRFYHWHMEIMPRLTKVAGFEWGTGMYINPTAPEQAAEFLREMSTGDGKTQKGP
ncbi:MAG: galactose-1-phosphate uridylyltransferase [Candidatus Eremiobacteraeota bacterium]|nr:galactose-1-phosphate uridylyltransferase [Candidatus Eremiobacteraeota bacterium]